LFLDFRSKRELPEILFLLPLMVLFFFSITGLNVFADDTVAAKSAATLEIEKRLDTIRYGIETQVIELLATLKSEKNDDYLQDLLLAYDSSTSPRLKAALLEFYADRKNKEAEKRATELIRDRDKNEDFLVASAFSYLLAIKSQSALEYAVSILDDEEKKYIPAAIKTIGAMGSELEAEVLRTAYDAEGADAATKEAIILALGSMKSTASFDLISSILKTDESTKTQRMYACTALGELADPRSIPVLIEASQTIDPNVRSYAIAALGTYDSLEAMAAVREGLRDSHVLVRLAAVKAIGKTLDKEAIPFLEYKASYDPEKAVREASIAGLAAIGGAQVEDYLTGLFGDAKMAVQYRSTALGSIVAKGGEAARQKALEAFMVAQADKDRALFTAYAKAALAVDDSSAEPFAQALLADKDFSMRLGAILWVDRNKAVELKETLRVLSETDPNDAVKKRAALALGRL